MLTTSRSFELASSKAGVTPLKSQQQESDKKAAPSIPVLYDLLIEYECLINSASFISNYLVMSLIRLNSILCWLIPDWFRRKAHYFTQCLLLMRQGVLFNYLLFNHHLKQNQIMEDLGKNSSLYDHIIPLLCSWYFLLIFIFISAVRWWTQKEGFLSTEMELSSGFPLIKKKSIKSANSIS